MKVVPQSKRLAQVTAALWAAAMLTAGHAQSTAPATSAPGDVQPPTGVGSGPGSSPPSAASSGGQSGMVWGRSYDSSEYSLLPYTRRGYVGVNLGQSDYGELACSPGFSCDDKPDVAGTVYTGGMFNDWLGVELGYLHLGRADRNGGRTEAQGLNVSLVAQVPIQQFSLFAKGGTTWGHTKVSADALALTPTGTESGWGASYGAGVGWDLSPATTVVLEWARHDLHFAGDNKEKVDLTSLGLKYRF